jgi:hypothetical protein
MHINSALALFPLRAGRLSCKNASSQRDPFLSCSSSIMTSASSDTSSYDCLFKETKSRITTVCQANASEKEHLHRTKFISVVRDEVVRQSRKLLNARNIVENVNQYFCRVTKLTSKE